MNFYMKTIYTVKTKLAQNFKLGNVLIKGKIFMTTSVN